jgi:hypothetical protein
MERKVRNSEVGQTHLTETSELVSYLSVNPIIIIIIIIIIIR